MVFYKFLYYPNTNDVFILYDLDEVVLNYILDNLNDAIILSYPISKFYMDYIRLTFSNGKLDVKKTPTIESIDYELINPKLLETLKFDNYVFNEEYIDMNDQIFQKISLKAYALISLNIYFKYDVKLVAIGLVLLGIDFGIITTPFYQLPKEINTFFSYTPENFKSLSIENQNTIFELCRKKKNFILTGSTGIGKTKIIPKLIFLFHFYFEGIEIDWDNITLAQKKNIQYNEVLFVLPRKVLITNVGKELYKSLGFKHIENSPIHYLFQRTKNQTDVFNKNYRKFKTSICISIDRLAFNRITTAAFVIVDEVHENNIFSDIFITIIKNKKKPICLITATPDDQLDEIKHYFKNITHVNIQGPTRFKIDVIQEKVLNRRDIINGDENLIKIIERYSKPKMCILFFLASVAEINLLMNYFQKYLEKKNIKIFAVFRQILNTDPTIIERIEQTKEPSVVLTTNILESSITIRNVGVVIDTGRFFTYVFFTNFTLNITKSMMLQRMGRVGRVSDGLYIKLYEKLSTYKKIDNNFLFLYIIFNLSFNISVTNFFSTPKDINRVKKTIQYMEDIMKLDLKNNISKIYKILLEENCNIFEYVRVYLFGSIYQKEQLRKIDTREIIDLKPIILGNIKNYVEIAKLINIPLIKFKFFFKLKNNFENAHFFKCEKIETNYLNEPYLISQTICLI